MRNLAFYKKSSNPWTKKEFENILKYCGDSRVSSDLNSDFTYIFDNGNSKNFMFTWEGFEFSECLHYCDKVSYEGLFGLELNELDTILVHNIFKLKYDKCVSRIKNIKKVQENPYIYEVHCEKLKETLVHESENLKIIFF